MFLRDLFYSYWYKTFLLLLLLHILAFLLFAPIVFSTLVIYKANKFYENMVTNSNDYFWRLFRSISKWKFNCFCWYLYWLANLVNAVNNCWCKMKYKWHIIYKSMLETFKYQCTWHLIMNNGLYWDEIDGCRFILCFSSKYKCQKFKIWTSSRKFRIFVCWSLLHLYLLTLLWFWFNYNKCIKLLFYSTHKPTYESPSLCHVM